MSIRPRPFFVQHARSGSARAAVESQPIVAAPAPAEIPPEIRGRPTLPLDERPLRSVPAAEDPGGADVLLRWARRILERDCDPDEPDVRAWLEVFDRRDGPAAGPRCGWD